jgi:nitroreductase
VLVSSKSDKEQSLAVISGVRQMSSSRKSLTVIEAMRGRASTRAFEDRSVSKDLVREIIDTARWAPSGVNTQPWQVAVVTGKTKRQIGEALTEARLSGQPPDPDYGYYPDRYPEPYLSRQRACGYALYNALGIKREDTERRMKQWLKNYHGFGAPVELMIFIDETMAKGSWLDMGMFVQNVMLSARHYGLETCPQASMAEYPNIIRRILGLPKSMLLVCGIALGYPCLYKVV